MSPSKDNRISLSDDVDEFNNKFLKITTSFSKEDIDSINLLNKKIKSYFELNNIGILETRTIKKSDIKFMRDASHHLGGLRMGKSSSSSVVDKNLKVHSLNNVYLLCCGVFPTSGSGNPSWTLAALAIKLSNHIFGIIKN